MFERDGLKSFLETGEQIDGIPCGFWTHFSEQQRHGMQAVRAHIAYYQKTKIPLMKVMNEHPLQIDCQIRTPCDWRKIGTMIPEKTDYQNYLDEIKTFRKEAGSNAFILATIHGILVSACHATDGMGKFPDLNNTVTRHLKEEPEQVEIGLRNIAHTLELLSLACLEAGADGIYYAALGGEEERFTEELYKEYVKPLETELLGQIKEKGTVVLHICKANPRLPMFQGYPCHVVNWAEHSSSYSLEDGMTLFPNQRLIGGFDNQKGCLLEGPMETVLEQIRRTQNRIGKSRLIVGADCTLPETMDLERLRIAMEYAQNQI